MQTATVSAVSNFVIAHNGVQNDESNDKTPTYFDFIKAVNTKIANGFAAQIEAGIRPSRPKAGIVYYTILRDIRPDIAELLIGQPFNPIHAWNIDPRCNEFVQERWNA